MAYTAEGIASYLKKMNKDYYGNKTWEQMFGNVSLAGQQSFENLKTDFGQATGEAYKAAQMNQAALAGSNIISGMKSEMMAENELALQEAYDSYLKNFQTGIGSINEQMAKSNASINELLMGQAQNYADYANAHIDYLYSLWDTHGDVEGSMFNDPKFANYMKDTYDESGVVNGKELMGRGELENLIFDANGYLTSAGKAFFEQMEYDELLKNDSFDMYLRNANPELHEWALSTNPYDYAPNALGESTMAGTFREMTGRMSDDEVFDNMDRYLGMTAGTLNKRLNEFDTVMNDLLDKDLEDATNLDTATKAFSKLLDSIGLKEAYEKQYGDIEGDVKSIVEKYSEIRSNNNERAAALGISPGATSTVYNDTKFDQLQELKNLVIDLVDYVKTEHDTYIKNFHDVEGSNGAEIMSYDGTIAKAGNGSWYDYLMDDGSTVRFLSSANTVGSWDKEDKVSSHSGENFKIKYNGETYEVGVGREVMDDKIKAQIDKKMRTSVGRGLQPGDVFYDRGKIWVVTKNGKVKTATGRVGNNDYGELKEVLA